MLLVLINKIKLIVVYVFAEESTSVWSEICRKKMMMLYILKAKNIKKQHE
jgi:hypothetical protein